ncbi:MAG: xanthine dehydrogenase family protein molybdopterin-binding subunit [Armatimonadota bacterium]|nr:xanthine dehydrogenase family protein molybdopterin-binding subunit [Armatimonadota bacterium]
MPQQRTKRIKTTITVNGETQEVEIEVPDIEASWGDPRNLRWLGKRIPRVEGVDKVTGRAKYTYDIQLPGLLYGKILRSPHPRARVRSIDASQAERLPGVRAVITDLAKEVLYAGEEVAAVAAESEEIARDALQLIRVDYELLPFVVDPDSARKPDAPRVVPQGNVRGGRPQERGDPDSAFRRNDVVVHEGTYSVPARSHCCLEPHGLVCQWQGDKLIAWASTQGIFSVRDELANALGIPANNVRVICEHMGGGFGSKFGARAEGVICARLARMAGAPVKLMLERDEEQLATGYGPGVTARVKIAATRDGRLIAWESETYGTGGVWGSANVPLPYIYPVPNVRTRHFDISTNIGASAALRAPGHPQASFIMESAMDDLAAKLGIDPLEFRLKNDPNPVRQAEYRLGAERIRWERRRQMGARMPGVVKRGLGVASAIWGGGGGAGSRPTVRIDPDGSVEVRLGTQDIGTGTRTLVAAVVAEELGVDVKQVRALIGDTDYGYSGASGGSTTAASVAPAVKMAATAARERLLATVSSHLQANPADIVFADGKVFVRNDPGKSLTWKQACALLGREGIETQGEWNPNLQGSGVAGCQFVEVEVDTETGKVRVVKVVAIQDCGLVINRMAVESQIYSGVVQGMAMALHEQRLYDEQTGRMLNADLENYKLPGSLDIPDIEAIVYDNPTGRVSGMGEPPVIPTAAAIANAVFHAIGRRISTLPITPARVLEALGKV